MGKLISETTGGATRHSVASRNLFWIILTDRKLAALYRTVDRVGSRCPWNSSSNSSNKAQSRNRMQSLPLLEDSRRFWGIYLKRESHGANCWTERHSRDQQT